MPEVEGKLKASSFISKEAFAELDTTNCEFTSNHRFNVFFCDEGKILVQNARESSEFMHIQLP